MKRPDEPAPIARMERLISAVLRTGVLVSAAVIAAGVLAFALTRDTGYARVLPHHLGDLLAFHPRGGPGYFPTSAAQVLDGVVHFKPYAVVALGLALLVATPVVRVALSVAFFVAQRDWVYVVITLVVLGVLAASFVAGAG